MMLGVDAPAVTATQVLFVNQVAWISFLSLIRYDSIPICSPIATSFKVLLLRSSPTTSKRSIVVGSKFRTAFCRSNVALHKSFLKRISFGTRVLIFSQLLQYQF